jgi:putative ABC transport system permease protein
VRTADLGFNKADVITFNLNRAGQDKWPVLRNKLLEDPNIINAATAGTVPGNGYSKNLIQVETNDGVMDEYGVNLFSIDFDYFKTLEVEIVEGRDISTDFTTDTVSAVIVNQAMVARLNWENPIGKRFQFDEDSTLFHRVIGVANDFHHLSLYNPIEPLMFIPRYNNRNVMVRIGNDTENALRHIEESWTEFFPNTPLEYSFLDQEFLEQYEGDQQRGSLFLVFSIIMVFIASLGLLGLASFIAEQRSKEISIRKVLGAAELNLIGLQVREFIWLVLIGAIPAFLAGYYFMNDWLQNFEYHVQINFSLFAFVLMIIAAVTILTTGFHAFRAASANPSSNLKYE